MSKFDDIKIPNNIDEVTKMAIKKGKYEKQNNKRVIKIASILLLGGIGSTIAFPVVAKALPSIENVITSIMESVLPEPYSNKLKNETSSNSIVIKDNNDIVTLQKTALDNQIFIANMIIESDFLKQYDERDLQYSLHPNIDVSVGDKDNLVGGGPSAIKKIDDNKAMLVLSAYVGDVEVEDNIDIYINFNGLVIKSNEWKSEDIKELKGKWKFSLNMKKENSINKIEVNDSIEIDGKAVTFESIETTPLASYIKLTADEQIKDIAFNSYKIKDSNGKVYSYSHIDGHTDENGWNFTLAIYDDLSNIESLSITPYKDDRFIPSKIHNQDTIKMITTMDLDSEIEDKIFSRDVEKRDLDLDTKPAHKYEGNKISYHLDIDKERKFYTIDELIGKDIQTGNGTSVTIKEIDVDDKNTSITLKVNGDYNILGQIVLFDEDMIDTYSGVYVTHKGTWPSNNHWNNSKDEHYPSGEATFIIDKIDVNKKYKLAVPLEKEIQLNDNHTMNVKLK